MTFQDIFKSSFLENVTSVSIPDMLISLLLAFALGMFILVIYKRTFAGVMYSSGFAVTLLSLTMITTVVMLAVTSNVVLSLGMVGALSIVRFRTPSRSLWTSLSSSGPSPWASSWPPVCSPWPFWAACSSA